MAVVLVAGATPRGLPLAVRLDPEASARQLVLEALEAVAEVSRAAALVDEVAVAVVSVETEALAAAEVVDSVAVVEEEEEEEEEDLVVAEAVSDISPTATVPLTALPPVPVVLEKAASVADVVDSEVIVVQARLAVTETTDEAEEVVVGMIGGPAAQTTSLWAAETDQNARATAVERVGTAETMAHGSVGMKATATTIRDNEGGTDLLRWLKRASVRVCQGYLPFFRLILSRQWG
jgi:hypothetical protein